MGQCTPTGRASSFVGLIEYVYMSRLTLRLCVGNVLSNILTTLG